MCKNTSKRWVNIPIYGQRLNMIYYKVFKYIKVPQRSWRSISSSFSPSPPRAGCSLPMLWPPPTHRSAAIVLPAVVPVASNRPRRAPGWRRPAAQPAPNRRPGAAAGCWLGNLSENDTWMKPYRLWKRLKKSRGEHHPIFFRNAKKRTTTHINWKTIKTVQAGLYSTMLFYVLRWISIFEAEILHQPDTKPMS